MPPVLWCLSGLPWLPLEVCPASTNLQLADILQKPLMVHCVCANVSKTLIQPCQNVPAAGSFAAFSQFIAAYSTLDFTKRPLAGKRTWCFLPTTPSMLPTATKQFDRAAYLLFLICFSFLGNKFKQGVM